MPNAIQYFEAADEVRARLIANVAAVEADLGRSGTAADAALRTSFAALVKTLALTPPAQTRQCPRCAAVGMRAATRCGNCWNPLEVLPELPPEVAVAGGLSDF